MIPICHTWSMTLMRSTPPSSARRAISPSLKRRSAGPPSHVKSEMCRPIFTRELLQAGWSLLGGGGRADVEDHPVGRVRRRLVLPAVASGQLAVERPLRVRVHVVQDAADLQEAIRLIRVVDRQGGGRVGREVAV